ncbi:MAG: glycoside hydrolase family 2 protein, partial [Bacteroidota bacterium]
MTGSDVGVHPDTPTRTKIDLNGVWSYSLDETNWESVKVPSAFDYEGQIIFLRKFSIDDELMTRRALTLVALGINYEAEISVNDVFIGRHVGGYTSFEFEIPDAALRLGAENVLKIVVRNELNARTTLPLRKQIWGWRNYAGIFRDIYLLSTPRQWVEAVNVQTEVSGDFRQGTVRVAATITSGRSEQSVGVDALSGQPAHGEVQELYFQIGLIDKQNNAVVVQSSPVPVTVAQNRKVETLVSVTLLSPKLWSPESPDLYRLRASLFEAEGNQRRSIDEIERNIGFRVVSLQNRSVLVNGKKTPLRGVIWHEDSPAYGSALSYEQMEKDVALIKTLGANAIRFEFHPPHPYMMNLCSRYGLFVLEEIPVWNVPAAILAQEHFQVMAEGALREMVQRDRHQTSLLAWGVGSEFDSSDPRARSYVERMTRSLHALDSRPVYFGSRMVGNDLCSDLVDFAALAMPSVSEEEFKEILSR